MRRQCFATALPLSPAIIGKNARALLHRKHCLTTTVCAPQCPQQQQQQQQPACLSRRMYRPVRFKEGTPRPGLVVANSKQRRHESSSGSSFTHQDQIGRQSRTPWHREGSDSPPVVMQPRPTTEAKTTKGKLLTTPSRLLKLIVPLTAFDDDDNNPHDGRRKDIEPLALLVHPQQPLSYLERLIQSELPPITTNNVKGEGEKRVPAIHFRAEDLQQDAIEPKARCEKKDDTPEDMHEDAVDEAQMEETRFEGKMERTGKVRKTAQALETSDPQSKPPSDGPGDQGAETHSNDEHDLKGIGSRNFVRWSTSTDIGDFIRDAARGKEFEIEIEGIAKPIRIGVPSFNDRTHYLRQRLRKTANKIIDLAAIKKECDMAAHKGAQRVAIAGAGVLMGYWYIVYRLTFETDLGWDTMEPVTYLVGLSTLICGYLWFLYHNREVSYRSAMNLTISRRQDQLYQAKGFDNNKWESLIDEANGYRKEIKQIASEYDVEWDEMEDERDKQVTKAMRKVRNDRKNQRKEKDEGGDGDDDD